MAVSNSEPQSLEGNACYAFFGAAPDTTNRGVSALFRCVAEGIASALPESRLLVFDNGEGFREAEVTLQSGRVFAYQRVGARGGRRYYAPENLATMAALASVGSKLTDLRSSVASPASKVIRLGSRLTKLHPVLRTLDRCRAVLDVSGGDSFSDIYGSARFWNIVRPKLIAAQRGIPLVLLPQTYGPFRAPETEQVARTAVLGAEIAWARDARSFDALKSLLGDSFDPERHRQGVDMAFNLGPTNPLEKLSPETRGWLEDKSYGSLVGINVSGLVALNPEEARSRFHLRADYPSALRSFIERLVEEHDVRVLLIPHVMSPPGVPESDAEACERILQSLSEKTRKHVRVTPTSLDECEVKGLISRVDWFCGMRMHSTIAALSSKVPTAAVAYSDKTRGVFESCGVGDQVIDPRKLDTQAVIDCLNASWTQRARTANVLAASIPEVKNLATQQFATIVSAIAPSSVRANSEQAPV